MAARAENHRCCSSSEPKPPLKAAPDAVFGCMPDADMHSGGSFKSLAGQGFSDNDAVNVASASLIKEQAGWNSWLIMKLRKIVISASAKCAERQNARPILK